MILCQRLFFSNYTNALEFYTLSLHDALPIFYAGAGNDTVTLNPGGPDNPPLTLAGHTRGRGEAGEDLLIVNRLPNTRVRSEEHTSELQSRQYLVCRILLEKKKMICAQ